MRQIVINVSNAIATFDFYPKILYRLRTMYINGFVLDTYLLTTQKQFIIESSKIRWYEVFKYIIINSNNPKI